MLNYEISQILHTIAPYLVNTVSMLTGIIISNMFWKVRIYRYASSTILKTLEYQKNKIEQLEGIIIEKKDIISDQRGSLKVAKMAALKIMEVVK